MRASFLGLALVAFAFVSVEAVAAEEASGRYTMERTKDGIVRLDTKTGTMSLCQREDGRWSCESMDDSQTSLRRENERLEAENRSLRAQVEDMEETLGLNPNEGEAKKPSQQFALPREKDVDKAFDYLEGMLKEHMERLEEKHEEGGKGRAL